MDTQQIKERLRGSLEIAVLWRNLALILVIGVPFTLIYGLLNGGFGDFFWALAAMVFGFMVVPVTAFCIIRTVLIYRKPQSYIFCRTKLAQPRSSWKYMMYYTMVLEDPEDGRKFIADTNAIFYSHGTMSPTIEEYTNKTVTIAYNRETGSVVVIG